MSERFFILPVMLCEVCGDDHILGTPCQRCAHARALRQATRREKQADRWFEWNAQRSEAQA